jgi:hypothetical protein
VEKLISGKTCCVAGEFGVKNGGDTFMLRLRFLEVFIAAGLACGALPVLAQNDTPAQAAARAALEQQMNQMDSEQSAGSTNSMMPTNSVPPPPATPASQPPAEAVSQPPPAAPITTPTPTPQFSTNVPVNAEMESATAPAGMSQTNEPANAQMQSQTNVASMTVPPSVLNTNETEQYPVNPAIAPLPPPQSEPASTQPAVMQQAHPVAVPTTSEPGNQWPAPAESNPNAQQLPPSTDMNGTEATPAMNGTAPNMINDRQTTNSVPTFSPITAPPLPISQEQQSELQNLLSQYMANQITPTQYQEQRAKIMAGQ